MNEDTLRVECKQCKKVMHNIEFDMHDCPNTPKPIEGESWKDYINRTGQCMP